MKKIAFLLTAMFALAVNAAPQKVIKLPKPDLKGGKPLMQCLASRKSSRSFSVKSLSQQQISNLLWAAFGINRADGKRTAPTAHNSQDILIYAAMKTGLYLYEPKNNELKLVLAKDIRAKSGIQKFHAVAPINLIYVFDRKKGSKGKWSELFAYNHVGYISQNVYLYCASEGLSTVVCAWVKYKTLRSAMQLPETQKIILTQPVAYPK